MGFRASSVAVGGSKPDLEGHTDLNHREAKPQGESVRSAGKEGTRRDLVESGRRQLNQ